MQTSFDRSKSLFRQSRWAAVIVQNWFVRSLATKHIIFWSHRLLWKLRTIPYLLN